MSDRMLTLPALAHAAGVTEKQLRGAFESGAVEPVIEIGSAKRRVPLFSPDQVEELSKAARLVALGVGLAIAIKVIRTNPDWTPRMVSAA